LEDWTQFWFEIVGVDESTDHQSLTLTLLDDSDTVIQSKTKILVEVNEYLAQYNKYPSHISIAIGTDIRFQDENAENVTMTARNALAQTITSAKNASATIT
jgi:hypothetical protein